MKLIFLNLIKPMAPQAPPEWVNTQAFANTPKTVDNRTKSQKKQDSKKRNLERKKAAKEAKQAQKTKKGWSGWDDNSNWEPDSAS